MSEKKKKDKFT